MLSILSKARVVRNQDLIIAALRAEKGSTAAASLVRALNTIQQHKIPIRSEEVYPALDFDPNRRDVRPFVAEMTADEPFTALDPSEQNEVESKVGRGFELLACVDPEAPAIARALIPYLVFARHAERAGGSAANAVGMVWFGPPAGADVDYFAENLWHEATHQAVFIQDMLTPLFKFSRRDQTVPEITSAIRKQKREYDLSFHAACVGHSLVEFHLARGRPEAARELLPGLTTTVEEFVRERRHLTREGCALLDELVRDLDLMKAAA